MYKSVFKLLIRISTCMYSTLAFSQSKVLFVLSNQDHYGTSSIRTANHFGEIAVPYDVFTKSGYSVDFVSPKGGSVPIGYINASDSTHKKYLYNGYFMNQLKNTLKPEDVTVENYRVIFYGGGGAAMFGVAENTTIQKLARTIYRNDGIVAAICHGTAGLAYLTDDDGKSLYAERKITGFADTFEDQTEEYYKTFPFAIDEAIRKNGGDFVYAENLGEGFYVRDGRFVTGQDPSSATKMTTEIIALMQKNTSDLISGEHPDHVFAEWQNDVAKPGVAAGLLKDGKILYLKGFGSADLDREIPINTDTRFHIGSMARQFTAFAILLLEEQAKLTLSDDVRKYIPQLPDFKHIITLKHLLSQSSGLHDFMALKEIAGWREKDVFTQKDALNLIFSQKETDYQPGTKFSQTSSGLILLAEVVKQVTGQTLGAYAQENIFVPLGMRNTLFSEDNEAIIPNVAMSYLITKNERKHNPVNHSVTGISNLYTSVADMSRWYLNFENPQVGSKNLIRKLTSAVTLDDEKTTFNPTTGRLLYGQQYLHAERGVPKIWTYGSEAGYSSNIFIFPDQKVTSFVLGNNQRYNGSLAMNMAIEALGDIFPEPANIDFTRLKTLQLTSPQLNAYAGHYWDGERMSGLTFFVKNDTLRFRITGNPNENLLVPVAKDVFQMVLDGDDVVILKFRQDGERFKMIYTSGESDDYVFERYPEKNYSASSSKGFSGTYYCKALNVTYVLHQNGQELFTSNRNHQDIRFFPVHTDLFRSNVRSFSSILFSRDQQQKIKGFYVNSDKIRNLYFEKTD